MRQQPMGTRRAFFAPLWRGEVGLALVFWRDMLGVGTAINVGASFGALMLVSQGVDTRWAVALHFAPVPYNLFLFLAVWRCPQRGLARRSRGRVAGADDYPVNGSPLPWRLPSLVRAAARQDPLQTIELVAAPPVDSPMRASPSAALASRSPAAWHRRRA
jgi:hypothetical protein